MARFLTILLAFLALTFLGGVTVETTFAQEHEEEHAEEEHAEEEHAEEEHAEEEHAEEEHAEEEHAEEHGEEEHGEESTTSPKPNVKPNSGNNVGPRMPAFTSTGVPTGPVLQGRPRAPEIAVEPPMIDPSFPGDPTAGGGETTVEPEDTFDIGNEMLLSSESAFLSGDDFDAFQYYYAHMVAADPAIAKELPLHWVPELKRPAVGLRWGLGVVYLPAKNYRTAPIRIGDEISLEIDRDGANTFGGRDRDREGVDGEDELEDRPPIPSLERQLDYFTGDVGERLVKRLENRRTGRPYWGTMLENAIGGPGVHFSGARKSDMDGGGFEEDGGFDNRDDGFDNIDIDEHGEGNPKKKRPLAAPPVELSSFEVAQVNPGVVYIGEATERVLIDRAENMDLDLLLIFEVRVVKDKFGRSTNTTEIEVRDIANERLVGRAGRLNSVAVQIARQEEVSPKNDPVELALDILFKSVDEGFQVQPMPDLKPEHAQRRASAIVLEHQKKPVKNILSLMAEVRWYNLQGLFDDDKLEMAYKYLSNEQVASQLMSADVEERLAAVRQLLPRVGGQEAGEGGGEIDPDEPFR